MSIYKNWQLRSKILFAAVFPFVISLILTFPIISITLVKSVESRERSFAEEVTYSTAVEIKSKIENSYFYLQAIADSYAQMEEMNNENYHCIKNSLLGVAKNNLFTQEVWAMLTPSKDNSMSIAWIKQNGDIMQNDANILLSENVKNLFERAQITQKPFMQINEEKAFNAPNMVRNLTISAPILSAQNQVFGALGASIQVEKLRPILNDLKNYGAVKATLYNEQNNIVISSDEVFEKALNPEVNYQKYISLVDGSGFWTEEAFSEQEKAQIYRIISPLKFHEMGQNWVLVGEYLNNKAHADTYNKLLLVCLISTICLIFGISVSLVTAKNIATPITEITTALTEISAGNFEVEINESDSSDEIGLMTDAAVIFKQKSQELIIAMQSAEQANKSKSEFLANMSHELRTPMHAMLSYSKLGMDRIQDKDEKILKYFHNINSSSERLLRLVNNLLDLSKLEAGKMDFNFERNNIGYCIDLVVSEVGPLMHAKGVKAKIDIQSNLTEFVFDKEKMIQVLINVISNAIKFTDDNSVINIEVSDEAEQILIAVRDQGVGIPNEELKMIFDKFVQSSKTNKGSGGTGLGLSIAYSIVMNHAGKIWAENNPDRGAVIKILIPNNLKNRKVITEIEGVL